MKNVKYILGIVLIIGGLGSAFKSSIIVGLMFILLGIIFLPPVSKLLSEKLEIWHNKYIRYSLYIGIFIIAGSLIKKSEVEVSQTSPKTETQTIKKEVIEKNTHNEEPIDLDKSEFWDKFDPVVKERIYKMIEEKDCTGLQDEFNVTADNMDRLQSSGKSGERNLELMTFLEDKMKELDCH